MSHREIARLHRHQPPHRQERSGAGRATRLPEEVAHATLSLRPFGKSSSRWPTSSSFRGSVSLEELRSKGYTQAARPRRTGFSSELKVRTQRNASCRMRHSRVNRRSLTGARTRCSLQGTSPRSSSYSYINGFSRYQRLTMRHSPENQGPSSKPCENGLIESGGVPHRVQTDNAKVFVQNASRSNFRWNARYLHFCGHYGFEPSRSVCRSTHGAKGRSEKPFDFLGDSLHRRCLLRETSLICSPSSKAFQTRSTLGLHATIKTTPEELIAKDRGGILQRFPNAGTSG